MKIKTKTQEKQISCNHNKKGEANLLTIFIIGYLIIGVITSFSLTGTLDIRVTLTWPLQLIFNDYWRGTSWVVLGVLQ